MKRKPSGGKAASRRSSKKGASPQQSINTQVHPDAAGIDLGAEEFVVTVPPGRCEESVRTYATFTSGVLVLRDWLLECDIETAAIEITGNYWITLYDVLTEAGIEVYLVNARHVKGVPGKETDVCDAQWLQQDKRSTEGHYPDARISRIHTCVCNPHHPNLHTTPRSTAQATTTGSVIPRNSAGNCWAAFDSGSLGAMAFCRRHGIAYQTFITWLYKERARNAPHSPDETPAFAEVMV